MLLTYVFHMPVLWCTVYGDQFVDQIDGTDLAVQLVHGLQSDQLEEGDFEAHVVATLSKASGAVERVSESTLSLTIPRDIHYNTRAPERVSVSVPGDLLASKQRLVVEPSFVIYAQRGSASTVGIDGLSEDDLRAPEAADHINTLTVCGRGYAYPPAFASAFPHRARTLVPTLTSFG